jgi:hypothetical protein
MSFAGNYLELYDQVCFEVFWSYKTGTSKKKKTTALKTLGSFQLQRSCLVDFCPASLRVFLRVLLRSHIKHVLNTITSPDQLGMLKSISYVIWFHG